MLFVSKSRAVQHLNMIFIRAWYIDMPQQPPPPGVGGSLLDAEAVASPERDDFDPNDAPEEHPSLFLFPIWFTYMMNDLYRFVGFHILIKVIFLFWGTLIGGGQGDRLWCCGCGSFGSLYIGHVALQPPSRVFTWGSARPATRGTFLFECKAFHGRYALVADRPKDSGIGASCHKSSGSSGCGKGAGVAEGG